MYKLRRPKFNILMQFIKRDRLSIRTACHVPDSLNIFSVNTPINYVANMLGISC